MWKVERGDYCDLLKFSESTRELELIKTFSDSYTYDDVKDIEAIYNNREALYVIYYHPYNVVSEEPIKVKVKLVEKESKITLTTSKGVGETIILQINSEFDNQSGVWIDLNNNGELDEGEKVTDFWFDNTYTLQSQTFTIYGIVSGLNCNEIGLTSLDLSDIASLEFLTCLGNELTSLDLSGNTGIRDVWCQQNQLTLLNVSGCSALEKISCYENQLTRLLVDDLLALEMLSCSKNQLTSLDLNSCRALEHLDCTHNQLSSLDIAGLTKLKQLYCENNQMASLNVTNCTSLERLTCYDNELTLLNIAGSKALKHLRCQNNGLLGTPPAIFDTIDYLVYDIRYKYAYNDEKAKYVMIEDTGKGWWYSHEPEGGCHKPDPCNPI